MLGVNSSILCPNYAHKNTESCKKNFKSLNLVHISSVSAKFCNNVYIITELCTQTVTMYSWAKFMYILDTKLLHCAVRQNCAQTVPKLCARADFCCKLNFVSKMFPWVHPVQFQHSFGTVLAQNSVIFSPYLPKTVYKLSLWAHKLIQFQSTISFEIFTTQCHLML